jgi:hypothetical protein
MQRLPRRRVEERFGGRLLEAHVLLDLKQHDVDRHGRRRRVVDKETRGGRTL